MLGAGFNRNIVECKFGKTHVREGVVVVLIETLWNVNGKGRVHRHDIARVLIETLWNVNQTVHMRYFSPSFVLIETLWNVNF